MFQLNYGYRLNANDDDCPKNHLQFIDTYTRHTC